MSHEVIEVTDKKIVLRGRLGFHEIGLHDKAIDSPETIAVLNTLGVTLKEVLAVQSRKEK